MRKYLVLALVLLILLPSLAAAQTDNKTGFEDICSRKTGLAGCVQQLYLFALGFGALLSLLMLVLAGYKYMTAQGNASQVESAKEQFADAFIGLIIIFVAFILLNVINPDLVRFREPSKTLTLPEIKLGYTAPPGPGPGAADTTPRPRTDAQASKDAELANKIIAADPKITVSTSSVQGWTGYNAAVTILEISRGLYPSVCSVDRGCQPGGFTAARNTTVNPKILQGLLDLSSSGLSISFRIESLTTGIHSNNNDSHYQGNAVDLVPSSSSAADWIKVRDFLSKVGGKPFCENKKGPVYENPTCDLNSVNHIHWTYTAR